MEPPLARISGPPVAAGRPFRRALLRLLILGLVVPVGLLSGVTVASAHGGDATLEGYLLVQQALGHLAHDTTPVGIALAMEKVDDTLAAKDQEGVSVAAVEQAKNALEAGQVDRARELLQGSIKEALAMLAPATGEETGTTVVTPELPGRRGLTGRDAGFLAGALLFLVAGIGLAYRFRPADNIGDLRRQLVGAGGPPAGAAAGPTTLDGQS